MGQRHSAKCLQAHKNSPRFKPQSSSPFAQGKMKSRSFLESQSCAMRLFELIYLDLKSLPIESYHRLRYFIVFNHDKSLHMWMANLRKKSDASSDLRSGQIYSQNAVRFSLKCKILITRFSQVSSKFGVKTEPD